jgi:hypothetical protein
VGVWGGVGLWREDLRRQDGGGILLILPQEVAGAVPDVAPPPPALETGAVDDPEGLFRFLRETGLVWLDGLRRVEEMGSPGLLLLRSAESSAEAA